MLEDIMPWVGSSIVISSVFHIYRMYKRKSSEGQSLIAAIWLSFCVILWFFYGLSKGDWPLIQSNMVLIIGNIFYVAAIFHYRWIYPKYIEGDLFYKEALKEKK
jgi:uncharacterized protein with PQ loop repeat